MKLSEMNYVRICEIVRDLSDSELALTPDTSLIDDLGFDSLALIRLLLKTEEEFNLSLDFDDFGFEIFESIESYADFVSKLLQ